MTDLFGDTVKVVESTPNTLISKEAEEAVLGSILITPEMFREVDLESSDFYLHRNRWIWETLSEMAHTGKQIDMVTVLDCLDARGKLRDVGGAAYLTNLVNQSAMSFNAKHYAEIVRDFAARRRIIEVANRLASSAFDRSIPVSQTITEVAVQLPSLVKLKGGAQHISVYASRHWDRIEAASRGENTRIIPTGYLEFDEATIGGLREKELMWLIGMPGLGKTKWALQAAFQMGYRGTGVAVYSWETGEEDIMDREVSRESRIPQDRLERGDLREGEWTEYTRIIEQMSNSNLPLYVDYSNGMSTTGLMADLTRLKAEHGIQVFVIDYLKFFRDRFPGESETDRQNRISGILKGICRELSLTGIVIDVFNKDGMKAAVPDLDNQSQGADKSYDADKVLFMVNHIPPKNCGEKKDNMRTFIFGKSRRKLASKTFHMVAGADFPEFGSAARI